MPKEKPIAASPPLDGTLPYKADNKAMNSKAAMARKILPITVMPGE